MTLRRPITVILLLVLAARSLLPAGFMVQSSDAASGSGFEIVICTASGPKVLSDGDQGPVTPTKTQHVKDGLCAFAAASAAALVASPDPSLASEIAFAAVTYTLAAAQFAETPKPGAASARGPPSQEI